MTKGDETIYPTNRIEYPEGNPESQFAQAFGPMVVRQGGLTKREYFAAQFASGIISFDIDPSETAKLAVEYADALLAALAERKPE